MPVKYGSGYLSNLRNPINYFVFSRNIPGCFSKEVTTMKEPVLSGNGFGDRYELRIMQAFRRIIRSIDLHSRKLAAEFKVTGPQLMCLHTIHNEEPLTAAELSRLVHLSSSTIVGILDRLEDKGLIRRERSNSDRRRVNLTVIEAGKELLARAPSPLQGKLAEELIALPELERATIALSLERVVDLMEVQKLDAAPVLETGPIQRSMESGSGIQETANEEIVL